MRVLGTPAPGVRRSARRGDGGAAAVEFALIAPLFLAVLFGIVDYGWFFYQRFAIVAAVRDGIRAGLPKTSGADGISPDLAWPAAKQRALDVLVAGGVIPSPGTTVTWGPGTHYFGLPPVREITLSADYTYVPLVGFTPMPNKTIHYEMTMYLELEN